MKKLVLFFFMLIVGNIALAQAPLQLNFQGVARNSQGNALANQNIQVRLSIRDLTPTGKVVYTETRITTTNMVGVFTLVIGSKGATNVSGTILGVNWGLGNKFLQLEFDPAGNGAFVDLGTTQFQSVPYALNAYTATPIGEAGGDLNGYYPKPLIANNAINASKIANLSITDIKIVNVGGAKVIGDIKGNAANVTGIVAITNGGTGATSIGAAKQNLGLGNVDNTKDLDKPVSLATQAFLNSKLSVVDTATMLAPYKKSTFSSSALNTKLNIIDTAFMLRNYAKAVSLLSKAPLNSPTFTGTVSGITSAMVGLGNVNNTSDVNKPISIATQTALNLKASNSDLTLKAPLASPTFTGTVSGITSSMVGLGNVNNTSDANKPVSSATQIALDAKASISSIALKVNVADTATMLSPYAKLGSINSIMSSKLSKTDTATMLSTYAKTAALSLKAPLASPTFTGTVSGITSAMVGLGNVDNTSDANKPISTATQTALDSKASTTDLSLKAPLASPTFTGTVSGITSTMVGLGNVDNTSDANKPVSTATQTALDSKASTTDLSLKAPLDSPTFTGTVSGITSTMVGLGNVDNTSDANKPVSTATQTAIDTKAPLASPTFTGTVSGITSTMVGLGNVDNTSDLNKPISTATQTALDAKASNSDLALKASLASPAFTGTVSGITSTMVGLGNVNNTSDANKPVSTATQTALDQKANKNSDEVAIGYVAGSGGQGAKAIAIGSNVAQGAQAAGGVAIGYAAGQYGQGQNAVALGAFAGNNNQAANSIVLNATGSAVNSTTSGFFVDPLRTAATSKTLYYNTTTKEITYGNTVSSGIPYTGATQAVDLGVFDLTVNGIKIGRGTGNTSSNTAFGGDALGTGTGSRNTAIGFFALKSYTGTSFDNNTAVGYSNSVGLTSGQQNTSIGAEALMSVTNGSANTAIGAQTLMSATGSNNTALGYSAGNIVTTGTGNTFLGRGANGNSATITNATAIGEGAIVTANNRIQLGNTSVTSVNTSGSITASSIIKSGGTSSQYLMADGTVSTGTAAVREVADEFSATASQTTFTLTQAPSANSKVKMFINGIRISNTAYSIVGTTLTYNAVNNGSYVLTASDRIQFDYYY